ncbi:MAG: hypothetical protein AAFY63_01975 [Cyanobacteria bacterium J06643_13]
MRSVFIAKLERNASDSNLEQKFEEFVSNILKSEGTKREVALRGSDAANYAPFSR